MRYPLALLCLCLVVAGCSSGPAGEGDPTEQSTPTEQATPTATERPCPTDEEYDRRPVPDVPSNVTRESALAFAEQYEEARVWNADIDGYDLGVDAQTRVVKRTETGYIVHVGGGYGYRSCSNGNVANADGRFDVNYFVNGTTAVRLEYPENATDDPREHGGEVVA